MEYIKVYNQRCSYYILANDISKVDLCDLWFGLSRIGYYRIAEHTYSVNVSIDNVKVFDSLESFRRFKKI